VSKLFLLRREEVEKRFMILREQLDTQGISDELRGWNHIRGPIRPSSNYLLSVSEIASRYCPTMRDIYLRRISKVLPPPNYKMLRGIAYHILLSSLITEAKRVIYSKGKISGSEIYHILLSSEDKMVNETLEKAKLKAPIPQQEPLPILLHKLFRFLSLQISSSVDLALSKFPHIDIDSLVTEALPSITEMKVDGSLVGMSRELSVDVYTPFNAVIDFKTGEVRNFHRYTAAGYALAIEADKGVAINFGIILYISMELENPAPNIKADFFLVGDEIRREFIEIRDEAHLIIEKGEDPGMPTKCPDYCPYYTYCNKL